MAAQAFGALGSQADVAIPELARRANDPKYPRSASCAVYALGYIGDSATPVLLAQLADTNALKRLEVVRMFIWLPERSTNDSAVVPALLRCLDERDEQLRHFAALAIEQIASRFQPDPERVVRALTEHLASEQSRNAKLALLMGLAAYREHAHEAVPLLRQVAADPDVKVREFATNALVRIAPEVITNAPPQ